MRETGPPRASVFALLFLGVCAVSTGAIFARLAEAPALVIAAWRTSLATAVLLPFAGGALRRDLGRDAARRVAWSVAAGLFLALHFATWIASLEYTSVASSVLLVNTNPIWVALAAPLFTGERPSSQGVAGIALCLAGMAVVTVGDFDHSSDALMGGLLALCGAFGASGYLLIGRRSRGQLALPSYLSLVYGTAGLVLIAAALVAGGPLFGHAPRTYGFLIAMALVPQLAGHSLCNYSLRRLTATFVALSLMAEPVASSLLAWWILDQAPPRMTMLGAPLILIGIFLAARDSAPD